MQDAFKASYTSTIPNFRVIYTI